MESEDINKLNCILKVLRFYCREFYELMIFKESLKSESIYFDSIKLNRHLLLDFTINDAFEFVLKDSSKEHVVYFIKFINETFLYMQSNKRNGMKNLFVLRSHFTKNELHSGHAIPAQISWDNRTIEIFDMNSEHNPYVRDFMNKIASFTKFSLILTNGNCDFHTQLIDGLQILLPHIERKGICATITPYVALYSIRNNISFREAQNEIMHKSNLENYYSMLEIFSDYSMFFQNYKYEFPIECGILSKKSKMPTAIYKFKKKKNRSRSRRSRSQSHSRSRSRDRDRSRSSRGRDSSRSRDRRRSLSD